ncbi:MAG: hypothetical protein ACLSW7_02730 [Acutalibacteraceae bacterium]
MLLLTSLCPALLLASLCPAPSGVEEAGSLEEQAVRMEMDRMPASRAAPIFLFFIMEKALLCR